VLTDSQGSQPTVNPTTGQLWVGFINGGHRGTRTSTSSCTSVDGGNTFSGPFRVDTLYDVNEPRGVNGRADCVARGQGSTRAVPTNSCFRFDPIINSIVADKRGGAFADDVYAVLVRQPQRHDPQLEQRRLLLQVDGRRRDVDRPDAR
jgi:hypothetical protein